MNRQPNAKNKTPWRLLLVCHFVVGLMLCAGNIALGSQNDGLRVLVSDSKPQRGETIAIKIQVHREHDFAESPVRAALLRPTADIENLSIQTVKGQADVYSAEIKIAENAP